MRARNVSALLRRPAEVGSTPQRRWRALAAFGLVIAAMWPLLGPVAPLDAHAMVVSTSPPAGALLDTAPAEVTVTFNEAVSADEDSIVVIDEAGEVVSSPARVSGTAVSAPLAADADGWHAVSWWAVSADGHPISGAWTFRVGEGEGAAPEGLEEQAVAAARPGDTVRWLFLGSQWISTLTAAIAVGTTFVILLGGGLARLGIFALTVTAIGVVSAVLAAGANGPYASVSGAWFAGPASDEYLARAVLLGVVLAVLAAVRPRAGRPERPRPAVARAAPVLLAGTALAVPAVGGHAGSEGGGAVVAVTVHLALAGAWLGAIPALLIATADRDETANRVLSRFSRAATWLLAGTVVVGSAAVWMLTGGLTSANQSWGWTLFAKFALLAIAILAGTWNRWNVVPHLSELPRTQATTALRVEAVALVAIVAVSMALTHNGPPRAATGADAGPVVIDTSLAEDLRVQVIVDPARVGTNDMHVFVLDEAGMPVAVEELTITLRSDELGVAEIDQQLSDLGGGHYSTRTGDLGLAGTWDLHMVVRPDPFSQVELTESVEIAP